MKERAGELLIKTALPKTQIQGFAMSRLISVKKLRKQFTFVLVASIVFCTGCPVYALYSIADTGVWPKSWPKELEPLRKQARTISGPRFGPTVYEIPFTNREDFEAAWPHILKLKSKGASVILLRGPHTRHKLWPFGPIKAGVRILSPSGPYPPGYADRAKRAGVTLRTVTDIELIVDGDIVDLNRIRLPADTPFIDKRFTDRNNK